MTRASILMANIRRVIGEILEVCGGGGVSDFNALELRRFENIIKMALS